MARKSKIEPIREYLTSERNNVVDGIGDAIKAEDFLQAEQLKEFRRILNAAIKLCGGEKPKESKLEH